MRFRPELMERANFTVALPRLIRDQPVVLTIRRDSTAQPILSPRMCRAPTAFKPSRPTVASSPRNGPRPARWDLRSHPDRLRYRLRRITLSVLDRPLAENRGRIARRHHVRVVTPDRWVAASVDACLTRRKRRDRVHGEIAAESPKVLDVVRDQGDFQARALRSQKCV